MAVRPKLIELGWDVLNRPPYSSDLAPSVYNLLKSLQNSLDDLEFSSVEAVKQHIETFFQNKPRVFFEKGIFMLAKRWLKVIEKNGEYIVQ